MMVPVPTALVLENIKWVHVPKEGEAFMWAYKRRRV